MPFFDNSTAEFATHLPTRTYYSYMCPSKNEYSNKNVDVETSIEKPTWCVPQKAIIKDGHLEKNFSKLRDILSDTIASLTRENNLKKGESVELTLEIELMKSVENTPTNSLVQVTIIQHNSKRELRKKSNKVPNKMLFKIEPDKPLVRESSIHKRQSWFKRVTSRENNITEPKEMRKKSDEHKRGIKRQLIHKPLFCPTINQILKEQNNPEFQNTRGKLINLLPEKFSLNENILQDNHKTHKKETRQKSVNDTCAGSNVPIKLNKKSSLIKKISSVFLPPKNSNKSEVVETALIALKNEVDNMKTAMEEKGKKKPNKKRDRTPVHNLGKLVNNVLFDVMASMDGDEKNNIKEKLPLPLQYQSFFEPVTKTTKKHKKLKKRKPSLPIKNLYRSHSDTCFVKKFKSEIEPRVKSSNSISDCRSHTGTKALCKAVGASDTKQTHNEKRRKRSNTRDRLRAHKKILKNEKRILSNTSSDERKSNIQQNRELLSKSSLIQWNGQYMKVRKDIKKKIEMLIVNELENLALKEGMECDVLPLSSTDDSSKDSSAVEKMSSFICELDISDKNVRKVMKSKKSLQRKVSVHQSSIEKLKIEEYNIVQKGRTRTTITSSGTQTIPIWGKETRSIREISNNANEGPVGTKESDVRRDSIEIKYMNTNLQNWSAESQTITIYSPETMTSTKKNKTYECIGDGSRDKKNTNFISKGFIKIIKSDDSTWKTSFPRTNTIMCNQVIPAQNFPESMGYTTGLTTSVTGKSSSKISSELESSIEIELDMKDLEYILKEAKRNHNADKVLIEAKCVNPKKQKPVEPKSKNSPSYTNQLLTSAAKKLEKHINPKRRNKKSKY